MQQMGYPFLFLLLKSQFKNVEIEIRNREVNRKFLIRYRKKFWFVRRENEQYKH